MALTRKEKNEILNELKEEIFEQKPKDRGILEEGDYLKISLLIKEELQKIKTEDVSCRDEEFIRRIAEMLIETRSPCHELTQEHVQTLTELVKNYKLYKKGWFFLIITVAGLFIKRLWDWIGINLHWGQ